MGIDMDGMTFSEFTSHRLQHVCDSASRKLEALLREQLQKATFDLKEAHRLHCKTLQQTFTHVGGELDSLRVDHFRIDGSEVQRSPPRRRIDDPNWRAEDWKAESEDGSLDEELDFSKLRPKPPSLDSPTGSGSLQHFASRVTFDGVGGDDLSEPLSPSSGAGMPRQTSEVTLHKVWTPEDAMVTRAGSKRLKVEDRKPTSRSRSMVRSGQEILDEGCSHYLVLRPNGFFCIFWDIVCTVAIAHDTVMIPLLSAFSINQAGVPEILEAVSGCVWMTDILISFLRGFIDTTRGLVEMRLRYIAYRYVTTWFLPDVSMALVDGLSLFLVEMRDVDALTLLRLFRNLRLVRLLKMTDRFRLFKDVIISLGYGSEWTSVYMETGVGVLKHLAFIALLCHFTGCAWHAMGGLPGMTTWVIVHTSWREQEISVFEHDWLYMYMTSVHWSLTQFTPAAMDVVAVNALERIFSVVVTLAGLIVFSFFLGSINQNLARLRSLHAQERLQNRLVRRYVSERHISVELATEILAWIKQRRRGKANSKTVFSDIKALENLPTKLLTELQQEVGLPVLESHAMLKHLAGLGYQDAVRLCTKALKEVSSVFGEELFHSGAIGDKMFFVRSGRLNYTWELKPKESEDVLPQGRVGEATLWLQLEYCGRLACADHSAHLFYLDATAFRKVLSKSENIEVLTVYARLFSKLFLEQKDMGLASDLFGDDSHVSKLMRRLRTLQVGASILITADASIITAKPIFLAWKAAAQAKHQRSKGLCWPFLNRG